MAEKSLENGISPAVKLQAIDHAPIGMTIADATRPDQPLVYVNDSFEALTGYSRAEILGQNCRFLQGPQTAEEPIQQLREGIETGTETTVELRNYRKSGDEFWNRVTVAPIRDETDAITHFVGFQVDVTERKEAALGLQAERRALDRLIARIHGLLHDVTAALMQAVSREETERAVCARILEAEPYDFAAFGEVDPSRDAVTITTMLGNDKLEAGARFPLSGSDPVARALAERSVQITSGPDSRVHDGVGAIAVAPLYYRTRTYGVLLCGTPDPTAFNGNERTVIEALGQTISIAINAAESRRLITTDNVVELEFHTDRGLLIAALASQCGATFSYEGTLSIEQDRTLTCYATTMSPADIRSALAAITPTAELRVLTEASDDVVIGIEVPERPLQSELVERGGEIRAIEATPHGTTVTVEALTAGNPRAIIDWFTDCHEDVTVAAVRQRDRLPRSERDVRGTIRTRLTERQAAALELAFASGWYDASRSATGADLAAELGVSRSTFHQHLRAAEHKVMQAVLDG